MRRLHRRRRQRSEWSELRIPCDQQESQLIVQRRELAAKRVGHVYRDVSFHRRAQRAQGPQSFELARDIGLERNQRGPVNRGYAFGSCGELMPGIEEHRFVGNTRQMTPGFFRREAQDGREPAHHGLRQMIQRGLCRAPRRALRPGGVEPIFDDVQVEAAELHHAEIMNLLIDLVKLVISIGCHDVVLQVKGLRDHPLIDCHQVIEWHGVRFRIETVQIP